MCHRVRMKKHGFGPIKRFTVSFLSDEQRVQIGVSGINFPDVPPNQVKGIEVCRQGRRDISELQIEQRIDAREQAYYWIGFRPRKGTPKRGTDLSVVENGSVAVTPLHLDLTEKRTLKSLKAALGA